jgi:hypothetical protein
MNTITKISAAVTLGLSLMGANLAADAANARPAVQAEQSQGSGVSHPSGKVIQLGTITVTRADEQGARVANTSGTLYLGSIQVTTADSIDSRYAASAAQQTGAVYLGGITVKARNHKIPVLGSLLALTDSTSSRNLLSVVGALVFGRVGG